MAKVIATSEAKLFIGGVEVGSVTGLTMPEKMVTVWLGGTFADGSKAGEVKLRVPKSIAEAGANAVKEWWFESIRQREADNA